MKRIFWLLGVLAGAVVFLFLFFHLAQPAAAQGFIIVNPGESIQAAIDGASNGDTILIMAGTYTESLTLNKPVSLTGVSSATTILHAEPNNRVLTVTGAAISNQVVISGLMITGGEISGLPIGMNDGGGVLVLNSAEPLFRNLLFVGNYAQDAGGAIYATGDLTILGSAFLNNTADDSGGATLSIGRSRITNSIYFDNHCTTTICYGGGIFALGSASITGTKITSNTTDGFGGGIYIQGDLTLYGSIVSSNTSTSRGGGIYSINGSTAVLIDSVFANNSCGPQFCNGGGFYVEDVVVMTVTRTTFFNNSAVGDGGGLSAGGTIRIHDSDFTENSGRQGAGVYVGGQIWVTDSLFEANQGGGFSANPGTLRATNTVFSGNTGIDDEVGVGVFAYYLYLTDTLVVSNTHFGTSGTGPGAAAREEAVIVDSYIANNRCLANMNCGGGGLLVYSGQPGGANLEVSNSMIISNRVPAGGGGIFADGPANIHNTTIQDNSCFDVNCEGGAMKTFGPFTMTQNHIVGNSAASIGGAVYAWQPETQQLQGGGGSTAVLVNNLFAENTAGSDGAGIYLENGSAEIVHTTIAGLGLNGSQAIYVDGGTAAITNTIITSHAIGIINAISVGVVFENYNLYFENGVNFSGPVTSGGNSILNGDPDFIDPAAGDYHIGFGSAGLDNALDLGILVDLDGNPRPIGAGPDRGAYEAGIPEPIAGLAAANDSPTISGNSTQLTATVTSGNGIVYDWDFGDGSQGSGAAVSHVYPGVGVYTAVVTASNSLNQMTATTVISIIDEAILGLVVSSNSPVQLGEAAVLTATITAGTNVSYSWDFGDGSGGVGQVVTHTYAAAGSYTVTVTATNGVGQVVVTAVVVVLEPPATVWTVYMPVAMKP